MHVAGWYQSWSDRWTGANTDELAKVDPKYTYINLSFVTPNCMYTKGQKSWVGTGLEFTDSFLAITGAISLLHIQGAKVLLSVGGAAYGNWKDFDFRLAALLALVEDLGCDGIEIDYEGDNAKATELESIFKTCSRIPDKLEVWLAGFSVGAYQNNEPPQSKFTGLSIPAVQRYAYLIDGINIMSYDAGPSFDPIQSYKAYRAIFKGPINIGMEVPPEAWGGHVLTTDEIKKIVAFAKTEKNTGICIWSIQKQGTPSSSDILSHVDATVPNPPPPVEEEPPFEETPPGTPPPAEPTPTPGPQPKTGYFYIYHPLTGVKRKVPVYFDDFDSQ